MKRKARTHSKRHRRQKMILNKKKSLTSPQNGQDPKKGDKIGLSSPEQSQRKRGRPRKVIKPKQTVESGRLAFEYYSQIQQQNFLEALRHCMQLLRINTIKKLIGSYYEIKRYLENSRDFGLLQIPFVPPKVELDRQAKKIMKEKQ